MSKLKPRAGTPAPQCGTGVLARQIAENGVQMSKLQREAQAPPLEVFGARLTHRLRDTLETASPAQHCQDRKRSRNCRDERFGICDRSEYSSLHFFSFAIKGVRKAKPLPMRVLRSL